MKGISCNIKLERKGPCIKQSGYDFVIRYYDRNLNSYKHISTTEAKGFSAAGLKIVTVFQAGNRNLADFTRASGQEQAALAYRSARHIGQPTGSAIFFTVDYNASPNHLSSIRSFFRAIREKLDSLGQSENIRYKIGVYGNGLVCEEIKDRQGLADYSWVSLSTGHRGSRSYRNRQLFDLDQKWGTEVLCNINPVTPGHDGPHDNWELNNAVEGDRKWFFTLPSNTPVVENPISPADLPVLRKPMSGGNVLQLQKLLNIWLGQQGAGLIDEDSMFGRQTKAAVEAFQRSNADSYGRALRVDGIVGALTWGSLYQYSANGERFSGNNEVINDIANTSPNTIGFRALQKAKGEIGKCEIGGNNRGPHVIKYLNGLVDEGSSWCAGFVSWSLSQASQNEAEMPIRYTVGARDILSQLKRREDVIVYTDIFNLKPEPGDVVVWWRGQVDSWMGHVGFVDHVDEHGTIYTIEGNKTSCVSQFDYTPHSFSSRLLGVARFIENE